jgi:hypothetical protein
MISCKIEEWNRQDAKIAERKKRLRVNPLNLFLSLFLLCVLLATLGVLAVPFPAFLVRLVTTLESIMSHRFLKT